MRRNLIIFPQSFKILAISYYHIHYFNHSISHISISLVAELSLFNQCFDAIQNSHAIVSGADSSLLNILRQ